MVEYRDNSDVLKHEDITEERFSISKNGYNTSFHSRNIALRYCEGVSLQPADKEKRDPTEQQVEKFPRGVGNCSIILIVL